MKKRLIDLQLFAEEVTEPATEPATETSTEKAPEKKAEPETVTKQNKADEKKYSDADLDKFFNQKFAELEKKKQRELDEAKKLAEMNAEQKANYERDKAIKERDAAIKERDELKKAASLVEMAKTARKMLADEGVTNISDELLSLLVTTDAETTKTAIDSFTKLYKEAVEGAVKDRLRGEVPKTSTNSSPVSEIDKRIKKYE